MLSRSSELRVPRWSIDRLRLPARLATPVLVVAALLCGAGIGSAVFASLWQSETSARQSAEQALAQERAHADGLAAQLASQIAKLRASLHTSQRTAAAAARTAADRKSLIAGLERSAGSLLSASTPLQDQAGAITDRSRTLSGLIRTLDNDLATLSHYVSGANGSNLDPAFLRAQLDYLKPSLSKVGDAADALSGQANRYSDAVRVFVRNASAYAATVKSATER